MYPSQLPDQLFCLRDCPTSASLNAYFTSQSGQGPSTPFAGNTFNNWSPTNAQDAVQYTSDSTAAVLKDGADAAVTFTDAEAYQSHPQYFNGVRSGRLFTSLAMAECSQGSSLLGEMAGSRNPLRAQELQSWTTAAARKELRGSPWSHLAT